MFLADSSLAWRYRVMTRESDIPTHRVVRILLAAVALVAAMFAMTAAPAIADDHDDCPPEFIEVQVGTEYEWVARHNTSGTTNTAQGHKWHDSSTTAPTPPLSSPWSWHYTGNSQPIMEMRDNPDYDPECGEDETGSDVVLFCKWNESAGKYTPAFPSPADGDESQHAADAADPNHKTFIAPHADWNCDDGPPPTNGNDDDDDGDDDDNGGGGGGSSSSSSTAGEVEVLGAVLGESLAFTGVDASSLILMTAAGLAAVGGGTMLLRRTRAIGSGGSADLTD